MLLVLMFITAICFYHTFNVHKVTAAEIGTDSGTDNGTVTIPYSNITLDKYPTRTTYNQGESLDFSDMILVGHNSDGTYQYITDYTISGYDSKLIGLQYITISYQGATFYVSVIVLPAKVTNIVATVYNMNSVSLTWDAVPGAIRYEIYALDSFGASYVLLSTAYTNSLSLNYAPATMFSIQICAVGSSGGLEYRGSFSDLFYGATAPDAVMGLYVYQTSATSVSLSWNAVAGASGYIIYRSTNAGKDYKICNTTSFTSYTDENLSSGKAYQYKVCAYVYSKDYHGADSNVADTSTNPAKMLLKYKAGEQKVRITWNKVTGASYYDIYIGDDMNGYMLAVSQEASSACSYTIEELASDQTYNFYAIARLVYNGAEFQSQKSTITPVVMTEIPVTSTKAKLFADVEAFKNAISYTDIAFFKKYMKYSKSYIMPGMVVTNIDGFASNAMCPQGITFAGKYLLMTAYDMKGEENSVVYIIDKETKKLLTTMILPSKTHAGGIAFDGTNVWIPTGTKVSSIPLSWIEEAIAEKSPFYWATYNTTCTLDISISYLTYYKDRLWIGSYNELESTYMFSYAIEDIDTEPFLTEMDMIGMPTRVQGVAFTKQGVMIVSRSCQLYKGLRGYMRQIDLYQPDFDNAVDGLITRGASINTVEMPSMNEGIAIDGSYLYVCYESVAFEQASYQMDRICAFNLSSLTKKMK